MPSVKPEDGKCGSPIPKSLQKYGKKMYCTKTAGYGTDHKSQGRCKFHGGLSTGRNGATRLIKELKKTYEPYLQEFKALPEIDKWDLDLELFANKFVVKKLLNDQIENEEVIPDDKVVRAIASVTEAVRKNIETQYKMRYEGMAKFQMSVIKMMVSIILKDLMSLEEDVYSDKEKRNRSIMQILYSSFRRAVSEGEQPGIKQPEDEVSEPEEKLVDCVL